jgi:zona occludens toxin (predicted ATPase)
VSASHTGSVPAAAAGPLSAARSHSFTSLDASAAPTGSNAAPAALVSVRSVTLARRTSSAAPAAVDRRVSLERRVSVSNGQYQLPLLRNPTKHDDPPGS